jgi:hypothetical protein
MTGVAPSADRCEVTYAKSLSPKALSVPTMRSIASPLGWQEFGFPDLSPTPKTVLTCGNNDSILLHAALGAVSRPMVPHLGLLVTLTTGDGVGVFGLSV